MPQGNKDTLVKKAQHIYHGNLKETGREFFDFMADHELFDLETKPGKSQGGYCTLIGDIMRRLFFLILMEPVYDRGYADP